MNSIINFYNEACEMLTRKGSDLPQPPPTKENAWAFVLNLRAEGVPTPDFPDDDWNWESVENDAYAFTFIYPEHHTWKEVNAKLEREHAEPYWTWRGFEGRKVVCLINSYRHEEWKKQWKLEHPHECVECFEDEDDCECEDEDEEDEEEE